MCTPGYQRKIVAIMPSSLIEVTSSTKKPVGRPKGKLDLQKVGYLLPKRLVEFLDLESGRLEITKSDVVRRALDMYIDRNS